MPKKKRGITGEAQRKRRRVAARERRQNEDKDKADIRRAAARERRHKARLTEDEAARIQFEASERQQAVRSQETEEEASRRKSPVAEHDHHFRSHEIVDEAADRRRRSQAAEHIPQVRSQETEDEAGRERSDREEELAALYAAKNNCPSMTVLDFCERKKYCDSKNKIRVHGRRIIDVDHFFNAMKCINRHKNNGCSLNDVVIMNEKKMGLCTSFILKCRVCKFQTVVHSENMSEYQDLNADFIGGMMSLNFDFKDINTLLSKLLLPSLNVKFFSQQFKKISSDASVEVPQKSVGQSADSSIACAKKRKRPSITYLKSSALNPASFPVRKLDEISLGERVAAPQLNTDQCAKKSPKSLPLKPQNDSFSGKEFGRTLSVPMAEIPLETIDQSVISPVARSEENKLLEISKIATNLPRVTYQNFYLAESANENKKTQKEPQTVIVQEGLSCASVKSKNFHQNDSVKLLVVDQFEIKEENAIEEESQLIIPDQIPKSSSSEFIVGQGPVMLDVGTIKQEINTDFDGENLLCLDTSKMQALSEKNLPESVDPSTTVLCQQKEIRIDENSMVGQEPAILDVTTIKQEINTNFGDENSVCFETSKMETLSEKNLPESVDSSTAVLCQQKEKRTCENRVVVNQNLSKLCEAAGICENNKLFEPSTKTIDNKNLTVLNNDSKVELPSKKGRALPQGKKVVVNQNLCTVNETEAKQNVYSSGHCDILTKSKFNYEKRSVNEKRIVLSKKTESQRKTDDRKIFATLNKNRNCLYRDEMINLADAKKILTAASKDEKKFFVCGFESNSFKVEKCSAAAPSGKPLQNMPESNQNSNMFISLKPHNLACAPHEGVNEPSPIAICQAPNFFDCDDLTYLSNIPTPVQQSEIFSSNGQPSTVNITEYQSTHLSSTLTPVQQSEIFSSNGQSSTVNIPGYQSTHLLNTFTPIQQLENFASNTQSSTEHIPRWIERGNMSSNSYYTGGTPKRVADPVPTKPHKDQSRPSSKRFQF